MALYIPCDASDRDEAEPVTAYARALVEQHLAQQQGDHDVGHVQACTRVQLVFAAARVREGRAHLIQQGVLRSV